MRRVAFVLLLFFLAATATARVVRVEVLRRAEVLGGRSFGATGAYEKIAGKVHFAVRPENVHNMGVVDLDLAPRNATGEVEFTSDFYVLAPKEKSRSNGALLLEIPNRGGKGLLAIVNRATGSLDPEKESDFGDGFLMERGYTVAWLGWQWDVRREPNRLALDAPIATRNGKPITGLVRSDFTLATKADAAPLGHIMPGSIGGTEYAASDPSSRRNVLTVRDTPTGERRVIPRSKWRFVSDGKPVAKDQAATAIRLDGGFEPGRIYELVYVARDPRIAGLGFAAVRDFVSYLKNDTGAIAPVRVALGAGISQSGRFLRHMLYDGFNADEDGRRVFDGMIPHVAGAGRGNFNHRFAQPSRDAQPMSAILYATDLFPFTDLPTRDLRTGRSEGLLDRAFAENVAPKIFHTNTAYEYWSRAASLIHSTPDGLADAPLPDNVRIYFYPGLQHFSGPFPPARDASPERNAVNPQSPLAVRWFWRSMITNLEAWVQRGVEPPASRYPRIADGTLVTREALKFPAIPGVTLPRDLNLAYRTDFGPEFAAKRIITKEPPVAGEAFPQLVPQVDANGNEIAGIRLPELEAPVATYTGWNLRSAAIGAPWARISFLGSYLPFPRSAAEQDGDPRLATLERYANRDAYLGAFSRAALGLVRGRFLLPEDLAPVIERGAEAWDLATGQAR